MDKSLASRVKKLTFEEEGGLERKGGLGIQGQSVGREEESG